MILFVLATLVSIASPFVAGLFTMEMIDKYYPSEKHRSINPLLRAVAVIFALGLPGGIMAACGYLWFSTSCVYLLIGLALLAIGLWTRTPAEAYIITAITLVLMIHLGLAVVRVKEERDRKKMSPDQSSRPSNRSGLANNSSGGKGTGDTPLG